MKLYILLVLSVTVISVKLEETKVGDVAQAETEILTSTDDEKRAAYYAQQNNNYGGGDKGYNKDKPVGFLPNPVFPNFDPKQSCCRTVIELIQDGITQLNSINYQMEVQSETMDEALNSFDILEELIRTIYNEAMLLTNRIGGVKELMNMTVQIFQVLVGIFLQLYEYLLHSNLLEAGWSPSQVDPLNGR